MYFYTAKKEAIAHAVQDIVASSHPLFFNAAVWVTRSCAVVQEKVRQYESRHHWDPRVLKVLLIAERYRQEKAVVFDVSVNE